MLYLHQTLSPGRLYGVTVATHTTFYEHRFFASLIRPPDVVDSRRRPSDLGLTYHF